MLLTSIILSLFWIRSQTWQDLWVVVTFLFDVYTCLRGQPDSISCCNAQGPGKGPTTLSLMCVALPCIFYKRLFSCFKPVTS